MILEFLINFCILTVLLSVIWKYIFVFPYTLLTAWSKNTYIFPIIIKVIGYYVTAAVLSLVVVGTNQNINSIGIKILIGFLGTFIYYTLTGDELNKKSKQLEQSYDYNAQRLLNIEYIIQLCSIIAFIIMIFIPYLSINPLTTFILNILSWTYNMPGTIGNIIRIVLTIVGGFEIITMGIGTILIIFMFIGSIFSIIFKKSNING